MKKIVALLIALLVTLSFAACKGEGDTNVSSIASTQTQSEISSEQPEPEKPEPGTSSEQQDVSSKTEGTDTSKPANNTSSKPEKPVSTPSKNDTSKPATTSKPDPIVPTPVPNPETTPTPTPTPVPDPDPDPTPTPNPSTNVFNKPSNTHYTPNQVTINPYHVYWQDGKLYADCYVVNGLNKNVHTINVKSINISNDKVELVKGANFGYLNNVVLPPYTYKKWTFIFSGDSVINYGADLSTLNLASSVAYKY